MINLSGLQSSQTIIQTLSKQQITDFQMLESYPKQRIERNKIIYEFDRGKSVQLSVLLHYSKPIEKQQNQQFIVVLDKQWVIITQCILQHYHEMIKSNFNHNNLQAENIWIHVSQPFSYYKNQEIIVQNISFTNYLFDGETKININDIIGQIQTSQFNKYNKVDLIKQLKKQEDEDLNQLKDLQLLQYEKTYELLKKLRDKKYQNQFQKLIQEALQNWYDQQVEFKDFSDIFQQALVIKQYQTASNLDQKIIQKLLFHYQEYQLEIFELLFKQFIDHGKVSFTNDIKQKRGALNQLYFLVSDLNNIYINLKNHYLKYFSEDSICKGDQYIDRIFKYAQEVMDNQEMDYQGQNYKKIKNNFINEQIKAFENQFIDLVQQLF